MTPLLHGTFVARSCALAFVLLALLAAAIELGHNGAVGPPAVPSAATTDTDPIRRELQRCQSLGEAGAQDEACLRTWAENRRRFLATSDRRSSGGDREGQ